jgi:hypothetical protein
MNRGDLPNEIVLKPDARREKAVELFHQSVRAAKACDYEAAKRKADEILLCNYSKGSILHDEAVLALVDQLLREGKISEALEAAHRIVNANHRSGGVYRAAVEAHQIAGSEEAVAIAEMIEDATLKKKALEEIRGRDSQDIPQREE